MKNILSYQTSSSAACVAVSTRLDLAAHKVLRAGIGDALRILPSHLCRVYVCSGHAASGIWLAMTFEVGWKGKELYVIFMPAGGVAWICSRWGHRSSERSGRPSLAGTRAVVVVVADLGGNCCSACAGRTLFAIHLDGVHALFPANSATAGTLTLQVAGGVSEENPWSIVFSRVVMWCTSRLVAMEVKQARRRSCRRK